MNLKWQWTNESGLDESYGSFALRSALLQNVTHDNVNEDLLAYFTNQIGVIFKSDILIN